MVECIFPCLFFFFAHAAHCSLCRSKGASAAIHAPNLHAPENAGPVQVVLRPCTLKPMQCPKGATQQTRPRSTTPVLAAGPKQHVPGGFSSSTPPQGGTPSGNLREEAPQGRHGRPAPTDVANPPADEFNGIPSLGFGLSLK